MVKHNASGLVRNGLAVFVAAVLLSGMHVGKWPLSHADSSRARRSDRLDPRALSVAESAGRAPVIVHLAQQADLHGAFKLAGKVARTRYVVGRLRAVADRTQPPLVQWLEVRGAGVERFFIDNVLAVEADAPTLIALADRSEVASVEYAAEMQLVEPTAAREALPTGVRRGGPVAGGGVAVGTAATAVVAAPNRVLAASEAVAAPDRVEIGLQQIGVDTVWQMGYRGEGVVIAVVDSGVASEHAALKSKYRGEVDGHDFNWLDAIDGKDKPLDDEGHGTHVTGIAVGGVDAREIGAAPSAKFIACRVGRGDSLVPSAGFKCLEWVLAPTRRDGTEPRPDLAPDIVNASWSFGMDEVCYSTMLQGAVRNLQAAGILFVASAGNRGSACRTVCAPGAYPESLAVANYDVNVKRIYPGSSRGPVPFGDGELIKPDIAAPGVGINSSVPPNRYERRSGTSMAAPHVAGAAALLLSARPDLRGKPEEVTALLTGSGSPLPADRCGPKDADDFNNSAGHGLLHIDVAVATALAPTATATVTASATVTPSPTAGPTAVPTEPPSAVPERVDVYMPWVGRRASR